MTLCRVCEIALLDTTTENFLSGGTRVNVLGCLSHPIHPGISLKNQLKRLVKLFVSIKSVWMLIWCFPKKLQASLICSTFFKITQKCVKSSAKCECQFLAYAKRKPMAVDPKKSLNTISHQLHADHENDKQKPCSDSNND